MKDPAYNWIRLGAAITDIVILGIFWGSLALYITRASDIPTLFNSFLISLLLGIIVPTVVKIIQAYLTGTIGYSIGKGLWGLRVIHPKGEKISMDTALFRTFVGPYISGVPFFLGYAWVLRDPQGRAWHDLAAGTIVKRIYPERIALGFISLATVIVLTVTLFSNARHNLVSHGYLYRDILLDIQSQMDKQPQTLPKEI